PANTICPSLSSRALITASSSLAVNFASGIGDPPPAARGFEQLLEPDEAEEVGPRLRCVDMALEVLGHPLLRVLVHERGVVIHVSVERLVSRAALVRRTAERHLDHRFDGE